MTKKQLTASQMGKRSAAKLTKAQRIAKARKAALARWGARVQKDAP